MDGFLSLQPQCLKTTFFKREVTLKVSEVYGEVLILQLSVFHLKQSSLMLLLLFILLLYFLSLLMCLFFSLKGSSGDHSFHSSMEYGQFPFLSTSVPQDNLFQERSHSQSK